MALRIATNIASINAQTNLRQNQNKIGKSFEQLSSGSRINKASDDAAGLAISEGLKAQISSGVQARRNANDGISLVQVAEGGMNEISNIVVRLRELGVQAASDTMGEQEREFLNLEAVQLKQEIQRISETTSWGSKKLLDGSAPAYDIQVGINGDANSVITFDASQNATGLSDLGLDAVDFTSKEGARDALAELDGAQNSVNGMRANIGAFQNRLNATIANLSTSEENLSAAKSRITDTDIAAATADLTKNSILTQAATSTLAQANASATMALKLIG